MNPAGHVQLPKADPLGTQVPRTQGLGEQLVAGTLQVGPPVPAGQLQYARPTSSTQLSAPHERDAQSSTLVPHVAPLKPGSHAQVKLPTVLVQVP